METSDWELIFHSSDEVSGDEIFFWQIAIMSEVGFMCMPTHSKSMILTTWPLCTYSIIDDLFSKKPIKIYISSIFHVNVLENNVYFLFNPLESVQDVELLYICESETSDEMFLIVIQTKYKKCAVYKENNIAAKFDFEFLLRHSIKLGLYVI